VIEREMLRDRREKEDGKETRRNKETFTNKQIKGEAGKRVLDTLEADGGETVGAGDLY
jgi:hypothetical protein